MYPEDDSHQEFSRLEVNPELKKDYPKMYRAVTALFYCINTVKFLSYTYNKIDEKKKSFLYTRVFGSICAIGALVAMITGFSYLGLANQDNYDREHEIIEGFISNWKGDPNYLDQAR